MAKILVYNNDDNKMETYYRGENEAMPYNTNKTLTVKEFRGSSKANIMWTTRNTMRAWNSTRYLYGKAIPVGYAFRRSWEGGHGLQSQHYAGVAFDVGQTLTNTQRSNIRNIAKSSGVWSYVEPVQYTPTWVHFDKRQSPPSCASGGYPLVKQGSRGVYVLVLQDGLNTLGFRTGGLDGIFGAQTKRAVQLYQSRFGLTSDGIVGCNTWRSIQEDVVGMGKSRTTID